MQDNMKHNNIHIIGTPKGEEEKLGQENLFEKVMTEIFPNLMRKNIMWVQEAQRVPIKNPKRPTPGHIIMKREKFKDKENIKSIKGETASDTQGSPNKAVSWLLNRNTTSQKRVARNIPSNEKQRPATKTTLSSKTLI